MLASTTNPSSQILQRYQAVDEQAKALEPKLNEHAEGEILVKTDDEFRATNSLMSDYGLQMVEEFDIPKNMAEDFDGRLMRLKLPHGVTMAQAMVLLKNDERVEYAAPNDKTYVRSSPSPRANPPELEPKMWGLHNTGQNEGKVDADIDAPEAWTINKGSRSGPVIAVIDTGIDVNHSDLKANLWTNPGEVLDGKDNDGNGVIDDIHGFNALDGSGRPNDDNGHGTHCAGTIGATADGQGAVGVNREAQIMAVKHQGPTGGFLSDAVKAILYASKNGARIQSHSWGAGDAPNEALKDALESSPSLHIIAAGNSNNNNDVRNDFPASYVLDNAIKVAATNNQDIKSGFSSYGLTTVDVAAPGNDIYSTYPGGGWKNLSGTSMATPHVAGIAGLIATEYPDATNAQIKSRILNSVDLLPNLEGLVSTSGRVNAYNALENDTVAPSKPGTLTASTEGPTSLKLSWGSSGDDDAEGEVANYIVKVSDTPIVSGEAGPGEVSFDKAENLVTGRHIEKDGSVSTQSTLRPDSSQRPLYIAIKARDNVGNLSEMTTTAVDVPASKIAFQDDVNQGSSRWRATGSWKQVSDRERASVWTDSPNGQYQDNRNTTLTSPVISLNGINGSVLAFDSRFDVETRFDHLYLEARVAGTSDWKELSDQDGVEPWKAKTVNVSAYDGQDVQFRFRLKTDSVGKRDGVYLDNFVVGGQADEH